MTNKLVSVFFAIVASCAGCATVKPIQTTAIGIVDCTAPKIEAQLPAIVTEVTTDLLSKDYLPLLISLGQRVGDDVVACGIQYASAQADARKSALPGVEEPNADKIQANVASYLTTRGVVFAPRPPVSMMASTPVCVPACDRCHVCVLFTGGGGGTHPPTCALRLPRPPGC